MSSPRLLSANWIALQLVSLYLYWNHAALTTTYAEWAEYPALDTMVRIVCRLTNSVLVGQPLCSSLCVTTMFSRGSETLFLGKLDDFISLSCRFTEDVVKSAHIINLFPKCMRQCVNHYHDGSPFINWTICQVRLRLPDPDSTQYTACDWAFETHNRKSAYAPRREWRFVAWKTSMWFSWSLIVRLFMSDRIP